MVFENNLCLPWHQKNYNSLTELKKLLIKKINKKKIKYVFTYLYCFSFKIIIHEKNIEINKNISGINGPESKNNGKSPAP